MSTSSRGFAPHANGQAAVWSHMVPGMNDNDTTSETRTPTPKEVEDRIKEIHGRFDIYQVRTLPRAAGGGYGLYFNASNEDNRRWFSVGGYDAMTPYAAQRFDTPEGARKCRGKLTR